ncbi:MAG: DUF1425 domain-containing protein [Tepidisphaeraceae bacterium]
MRILSTTLMLAALSVTSVGCNNPRPPVQGRMDPFIPPQVALASKELANDILINAPTMTRDEAGILYVTLPVRSDVNQTIHIDYRPTFFDRTGRVIEQRGWSPKTLQSNVPDQISFNSTSPAAADVQIALRYAK